MLRVRGANVHPQAVGALLGERAELGRYAIVAEGDPIEPPLRILIETTAAEPDLRESRRSSGAGSARPWSCGRSLPAHCRSPSTRPGSCTA